MFVILWVLDNIGTALTVAAALVIFAVVCVPMSHRPIIERVFGLFIGISTMGSALDRFAQVMAQYDVDGSVRCVAMLIFDISKMGIVITGGMLLYRYIVMKRMNCASADRYVKKLSDQKTPFFAVSH